MMVEMAKDCSCDGLCAEYDDGSDYYNDGGGDGPPPCAVQRSCIDMAEFDKAETPEETCAIIKEVMACDDFACTGQDLMMVEMAMKCSCEGDCPDNGGGDYFLLFKKRHLLTCTAAAPRPLYPHPHTASASAKNAEKKLETPRRSPRRHQYPMKSSDLQRPLQRQRHSILFFKL
jgi:hypothetical protein